MEVLVASAIGVLTAAGVYLLLRRRSFPVILGLTLLSYAVNLFVFSMGRLRIDGVPRIVPGGGGYSDPLAQALVLTAIVIGFAMTAFLVVLSLRAAHTLGGDEVDAAAPTQDAAGPR